MRPYRQQWMARVARKDCRRMLWTMLAPVRLEGNGMARKSVPRIVRLPCHKRRCMMEISCRRLLPNNHSSRRWGIIMMIMVMMRMQEQISPENHRDRP